MSKFAYFKMWKKSFKFAVAEQSGCGNELKSLQKNGGKNEMSFKNLKKSLNCK